jgi:Ca2+-binding EF-hand superfamily protein
MEELVLEWVDEDHDGTLSREEISRLWVVAGGAADSDAEWRELCEAVGADPEVGMAPEQLRAYVGKQRDGGAEDEEVGCWGRHWQEKIHCKN